MTGCVGERDSVCSPCHWRHASSKVVCRAFARAVGAVGNVERRASAVSLPLRALSPFSMPLTTMRVSKSAAGWIRKENDSRHLSPDAGAESIW